MAEWRAWHLYEVVEMRAAQAELAALRDRLDLLLRRDLVALNRD